VSVERNVTCAIAQESTAAGWTPREAQVSAIPVSPLHADCHSATLPFMSLK